MVTVGLRGLASLALLGLILTGEARAQIFQQGGAIPQHLMMSCGTNCAQDAGGVARQPQGFQPFELGIVAPPNAAGNPFPATATGQGPNGENSCLYDAPLGQAGHYLCFSPNIGSNKATISFGSVGGGVVGSLQYLVNGVAFPITAGAGNVVGPASSVTGNLPSFTDTSGKLLSDSGIATSSVLTTSAAAAIYAPLASPTFTGVPLSTTPALGDNSTKIATTAFVKGQGYLTSVSVPIPAPQGRLTLISHTPVMVTSSGNTSTIFYDAYVGSTVPVFNGSTDVLLPIPANEISLVLTSLEEAANFVFDVWAFNNGGTLTLCTATNAGGSSGKGWAGDTGGTNLVRGTGYSQLSLSARPYVTNANQITNCFGGGSGTTNFGPITANQATYLGTYATTIAGNTAFNFGISGLPTTSATFFIWNMYNRVPFSSSFRDTATSWTYGSTTPRPPNNDTNFFTTFVVGLLEEPISASYMTVALSAATNGTPVIGIGVDSSSTFNISIGGSTIASAQGPIFSGDTSSYLIGLHTIYPLEAISGVNNCTFFGFTLAANSTFTVRGRY